MRGKQIIQKSLILLLLHTVIFIIAHYPSTCLHSYFISNNDIRLAFKIYIPETVTDNRDAPCLCVPVFSFSYWCIFAFFLSPTEIPLTSSPLPSSVTMLTTWYISFSSLLCPLSIPHRNPSQSTIKHHTHFEMLHNVLCFAWINSIILHWWCHSPCLCFFFNSVWQ